MKVLTYTTAAQNPMNTTATQTDKNPAAQHAKDGSKVAESNGRTVQTHVVKKTFLDKVKDVFSNALAYVKSVFKRVCIFFGLTNKISPETHKNCFVTKSNVSETELTDSELKQFDDQVKRKKKLHQELGNLNPKGMGLKSPDGMDSLERRLGSKLEKFSVNGKGHVLKSDGLFDKIAKFADQHPQGYTKFIKFENEDQGKGFEKQLKFNKSGEQITSWKELSSWKPVKSEEERKKNLELKIAAKKEKFEALVKAKAEEHAQKFAIPNIRRPMAKLCREADKIHKARDSESNNHKMRLENIESDIAKLNQEVDFHAKFIESRKPAKEPEEISYRMKIDKEIDAYHDKRFENIAERLAKLRQDEERLAEVHQEQERLPGLRQEEVMNVRYWEQPTRLFETPYVPSGQREIYV